MTSNVKDNTDAPVVDTASTSPEVEPIVEAAAPQPKKPEPKKPEAKKPEPKKPEAKKPEPKKPEAPKHSVAAAKPPVEEVPDYPRKIYKGMNAPAVPDQKTLIKMLNGISKEDASPEDLMLASLAYFISDKVAMNLNSKEMIAKLMRQASAGVSIVTTLAEYLGVEWQESPVTASTNYSVWQHTELDQLGALILAHVTNLVDRAKLQIMEGDDRRKERDNLNEQLKAANDKIDLLNAQVEEAKTVSRDGSLRLNAIIASYTDIPIYVVGMLDPLTKAPVKFARLEEDVIKPVNNLVQGTRFEDWDAANDLRIDLKRALKNKTKHELAVLQLSLHPVKAEEL
jgi:hypothetical protein